MSGRTCYHTGFMLAKRDIYIAPIIITNVAGLETWGPWFERWRGSIVHVARLM